MSVNLSALIKLVKVRPEIYHRHYLSEEFHNTWKAKEAAWGDISQKLGVDVNFLKKKWRTLRDQFQRNYKRIQSSNGHKIEIHWPYFEKLLFLKDHCKSKDPENNSFKEKNDDDETQMSQFDIDTEDSVNGDSVKYCTFETRFEAINDEDANGLIDERELDDFYVVTTPQDHNDDDDDDHNEKIKKNGVSNSISDSIKMASSKSKRKSNNNDEICVKRAKHYDESEENCLDRKISDCLESLEKKSGLHMDHLDHFSNFIASMMRQWPQKRQCEAMNHFTNYVMEHHIRFKQDKE